MGKLVLLFLVAVSLLATSRSHADGLDYIVCTESDPLRIWDDSLTQVLFTADRFEPVKLVQSFDGAEASREFVRVQFPTRSGAETSGWAAKPYIATKSNCSFYKEARISSDTTSDSAQSCVRDSSCAFPLTHRPYITYRRGVASFGAPRAGRAHAANDLYSRDGNHVLAIDDGTVINGLYYFYNGTYAIEVRHTGGFVVRYGEVSNSAGGIMRGARVRRAQLVGYVGTVDTGCCEPMLHFEVYSGKASGPLTDRDNPGYSRRSDLLDATDALSEWERAKFGASW